MTENFHKLLLSELHMVVYEPGSNAGLSNRLLCEAVTVNENLRSLGYGLKPADLIRLAVSPDLRFFYGRLKALSPCVKAEPMYPGFPQQVMQMSEAQFRLHQALHYFSTCGLELFTGAEVSRGWLPDYDGPARTEADTLLLDAAVLELVPGEDAAITALKRLLSRRERLTNLELSLVVEAAALCSPEEMEVIQVRFKENLDLLFPLLVETADRETALRTLGAICAHAGDALRCTAAYLSRKKYHLRTSEKKLLVKLLECYSAANLRQNLMRSASAREQHLNVLKHLDYNRFSRSPEHREAVQALRSGELLSWDGVGQQLLSQNSPQALTHLAQRPGYMVRMLNRLLSLGYSREAILDALLPRADALSGHLLLKTLRTLSGREARLMQAQQTALSDCERRYARARAACQPDRITRVWEDNAWAVRYTAASRRKEASEAYLDAKIRSLHRSAAAMVNAPRAELRRKQEALSQLRKAQKKQEQCLRRGKYVLVSNAHSAFDPQALLCRTNPDYFPQQIAAAEQEISFLEERLQQTRSAAALWLENHLQALEQPRSRIAQQQAEIDRWEAEQLASLEQERLRRLDSCQADLRALQKREQQELEALQERHRQQRRMCGFDDTSASIAKELLAEHYRRAATPLKGRKVFCRLEQFDLAHSVLETEDRSGDGGYIRSGICYAIPEDARYVRFFVYWNDPNRVDIDLHAGGVSAEGEQIHVGWNAGFRQCGVLHSGDITHSDAAEYIDIDLAAPIREISANVHLFSGKNAFREIETCYIGMMAVDKIGAEVQHYNPANCFFTHRLSQNVRNLFYGYVDVGGRFVRFIGQPNRSSWDARPLPDSAERMFSLGDYLTCLLDAQGAETVSCPEDADVVLTMGKSTLENGISLVDHNFFLEC